MLRSSVYNILANALRAEIFGAVVCPSDNFLYLPLLDGRMNLVSLGPGLYRGRKLLRINCPCKMKLGNNMPAIRNFPIA